MGACVLFTPKAFANGGYLFSQVALFFSGYLTTVCALKLVRIGQKINCFSYSEIVRKAFGSKGKNFLDFMIFST
jgi:amino acid permease